MSEPPGYLFSLLIDAGDPSAPLSVAGTFLKIGLVLLLVAANGFFVAAQQGRDGIPAGTSEFSFRERATVALLRFYVSESETYTSIGGFLMTAAGRLLKTAETVEHNGLVFRTERVERRRVMRVRLQLPTAQESEWTSAAQRVRAAH